MSIRLRLTLWYSGLLTLVLVGFGVILYTFVQQVLMSEVKKQLVEISQSVEFYPSHFDFRVGRVSSAFDPNTFYLQLVNYTRNNNGTITQISPNMFAGGDREELTFPYPAYNNVKSRFIKREIGGMSFLIYENPLVARETGALVGLLQIGAFVGREEAMFAQLRSILWLAGSFGLAAAFALGMFLSRKALRPINRVTEAAMQIQNGSSLGMRIPRDKPNDEIGLLTDTLNGMLGRIEKAYKELEEANVMQRRFVSDASHELRTPLTTIRGNIDLLHKMWVAGEDSQPRKDHHLPPEDKINLSREAIRDIADEARRMSQLVNDLLSLARADAGYQMEMEPILLRPLVEEAARRASFLPRQAEWKIGPLDELDGVWVRGNRDYLLQLLFILIENGFKYTPEGEVKLYAVRNDNQVGLVVSDTGIGIRAEELPHIFERFYRADLSRGETSGTGLGLSIAKWIADMHKGVLKVKSEPGAGSVFSLWLPVTEINQL